MLNTKLIALAVVAVAAFGTWAYVKNLQASNAELSSKVAELTLANQQYEEKVGQQNAAIEALQTEAEARLAAAQVELEKARRETIAARKRAQDLFRARPSTPDDLCKSALDLVNGVTP